MVSTNTTVITAQDVGEEFARTYFGAVCSRKGNNIEKFYFNTRSHLAITTIINSTSTTQRFANTQPKIFAQEVIRATSNLASENNDFVVDSILAADAPGHCVVVSTSGLRFHHTAVLQQNSDGIATQGGKS